MISSCQGDNCYCNGSCQRTFHQGYRPISYWIYQMNEDSESMGHPAATKLSVVWFDNSPGIEAQYRERVFRAFERLQSGGTDAGIGLALVRRIVESADGRAWINETPGGGCSVSSELPMKERAR